MKQEQIRKITGVVLVLLAFLLIGFAVHSMLSAGDTASNQPLQKTQETAGSEDKEYGEIHPITFDMIDSVLIYEIPEGISERLNVMTFDQALTSYLKEEHLIEISSGEETPSGLFTVKTDGLLTEDVNRGVFFFDITIDNEQRSMITVAVGEDGEYTFSQM